MFTLMPVVPPPPPAPAAAASLLDTRLRLERAACEHAADVQPRCWLTGPLSGPFSWHFALHVEAATERELAMGLNWHLADHAEVVTDVIHKVEPEGASADELLFVWRLAI